MVVEPNPELLSAASGTRRQAGSAGRKGNHQQLGYSGDGALYFHFPSKAEIAAAIVDQHLGQCASLVLDTQRWGLDGVATLERFINELTIRYQRDAVTRAGIRLANK